ncbi:MAG: ketosteroid isomerase-like protein [Limisphaerales bacterium]|jgi:ketosteroid isomerase-like protein
MRVKMKRTRLLLAALVLFLFSSVGYAEQTSNKQVQSAISEFLDAFTRLDWERFRMSFTEDATVFLFPMAGRTTVEGSFGPLFEQIRKNVGERKGPPSEPPYFHLSPEEVDLNIHGDSAVVTFHLRGLTTNPGQLGRRTLVMFRVDDKWRIAHLHASYGPETSPTK